MIDFVAARRMMVDCQVRPNDVTDLRLIGAMLEVPRERFVPKGKAELAYLDRDLPVADAAGNAQARRLLKPMVLAKLIQAAEITDEDSVLVVGCATGYSPAIVARLARSVVAVEEDAALARLAGDNLRALGANNTVVKTAALINGWQAQAPYDAILVDGAFEVVPKVLLSQLKEGGRLVGVQGRAPGAKGIVYRAHAGEFSGWPVFDATAPLLPGFVAPPEFVF